MTAESSAVVLWLVPTGLVVGHLGVYATIVRRPRWLEAAAVWLARLWAGVVAVAWVQRFLVAGHLPIFGTYESALSLALAIMLVAVIWEPVGRATVPIAHLATLVAAAVLGHGLAYDSTVYALTISERSWVVEVHAVLAWAAFAVLVVNNLVALRLVLPRGDRPQRLEKLLVDSLRVGFVLHTGMMVSGSVYRFLLFGRAWGFDPIETLGLAVWLAYGTLIHMHRLAHWSPRRLAGWCLAVFALLVISYRGIVYLPAWSSYHILDMNLRMHVMEGS